MESADPALQHSFSCRTLRKGQARSFMISYCKLFQQHTTFKLVLILGGCIKGVIGAFMA